jgi:hypothetical protein
LRIVLGNYFEDIRFVKFDFDAILRILKENKIDDKYNNTIYNINKEKEKDKNKTKTINDMNLGDNIDPFEIFNSERLKNLNIVFKFLIRPSYQNLVFIIKDYTERTKYFFKIFMIILHSFYLGLITFIYFLVWRQFENNLNSKVMIIFI